MNIKEIKEQMNLIENKINELNYKISDFNLNEIGLKGDVKTFVLLRISLKHGVGVEEIMSGSRISQVMEAKKELVFILKNNFRYTFQNIADFLHLKTHSSALYLYKKYISDNLK